MSSAGRVQPPGLSCLPLSAGGRDLGGSGGGPTARPGPPSPPGALQPPCPAVPRRAVPRRRSARRLNAPGAAIYQRQEPGKSRRRRSHWLPPPTCLPAVCTFVSFSCRPHGGSGKVGAAPPDAEDPVAA